MTNDAVKAGDAAPDFDLPRDGGGRVSLADLKGRKAVLYFYPRDDTPGCTKEAIAFTGLAAEFEAAGCAVFGISKDGVAKHDKFKTKHELGVTLLSDEEDGMCEAYGVWGEKKMYGKTFMGIERATFLLDAEGKVARVWRKVKVPGHAEEVLEAAKAL
ncbi:thioredoxin-dependent thiol peroxidase [Rhodovulum sp. DZ06]|uniref:thioredoxin-dependent thiol peroxidase n=1 Tax=Rhodovulum sp. DZ06 TaxID=3425126 RepID=UPI003D329B24